MIEDALGWLAATPPAEALRASRYAYPIVNAAHIMGLGTLFGAILALDLRLLGAFRSVPAQPFARVLPRVAAGGLVVAMASGLALFSVEPVDYAANPFFLTKVSLVALGAAHAIAVHVSPAWRRFREGEGEAPPALRVSAALSLAIWVSAIPAGRLIAFV